MDLFDKLKQVRISKRARRGAVLGLCLCAAAGLGMHLLPGGAPVGCTQEDLADTRAVMAVQASVSGSTDAQSGAAADKVVYLTFDDGPSATTESVLDTLKAEGVPATFFVMAADNNEEYLPLLERTVQEGHLIALHTCSHDYKSIYKSPDAYWDDLQKLREKLLPYVPADHEIKWLRFPGGSTNTVSTSASAARARPAVLWHIGRFSTGLAMQRSGHIRACVPAIPSASRAGRTRS